MHVNVCLPPPLIKPDYNVYCAHHVQSILQSLHWLPIRVQIQYTISTMIHASL